MTPTIEMVDTREITPGPNDRTKFNQVSLDELAANIAEHGLIQPITVRQLDCVPSIYQIVAGERRFRACKDILGWEEIPAIVKDLTDEEASAIMLAENVARDDLDAIDEGNAYANRMALYGLSAQDVADQAGVTVIRVRFRTKLLNLRPDIQALIRNDDLRLGYAQILANANLDPNRQLLALAQLRDNPRATPSWFRRVVNELLEQQAQGALFELSLLNEQAEIVEPELPELPPHPSDTTPPKVGVTTREIITGQATFWQAAAAAWDELGKPFKRQECQAAAMALQSTLAFI